jgi:hypothetical protein
MKSLLKASIATLALMTAVPALADTVTASGAGATTTKSVYTVSSTATVAATGSITKVILRIKGHYDYSYYGSDNSYVLKHNGKVVRIYTRQCGAKYNVDLSAYDTAYQDADDLYYSLPMCPQSNFNGVDFRPQDPMSGFNGMDASGTWELQLTSSSDTAKFASWSLEITTNTPLWTTGSYGPWSTTCGSATRTRSVTCNIGTTVVADSQCTGAKPSTTDVPTTQTSGCGYSWQTGTYVPTYAPNTTCGATTQTAPVTCQRTDGVTVADSFCTTTKPTGVKPYTDPVQCAYQWSTSQWYEPTTTCGDGTRTRQVTCRSLTDPAFAQQDSKCDPATKPVASEPVSNYTTCGYGWYRSGYSLSSCINGRQTYRAYFSCYRSTGTSVNYLCGDKPPNRVISQSCSYWAQTSIGYGDVWGDIVPGGAIGTAQYSTSGMNVGAGYLSKGTTSSGLTGYGNATSGSGTGGSGTGGVQASGGSYDPDSDVYTDGSGRKFTGGNYNSATGTYDNATLVTDPNTGTPGTGTGGTGSDPADAGRAIVMRRPLPQQ